MTALSLVGTEAHTGRGDQRIRLCRTLRSEREPTVPEDDLPQPRLPEEIPAGTRNMTKGKHTGHDAPFLDDEERAVIEAAERGEFEPDADLAARIAEWQTAASAHLQEKGHRRPPPGA